MTTSFGTLRAQYCAKRRYVPNDTESWHHGKLRYWVKIFLPNELEVLAQIGKYLKYHVKIVFVSRWNLLIVLFNLVILAWQTENTTLNTVNNHTTVPLNECRPAVALKLFGFVRAVEEAALEKLHGHHGEDEHEEHVDDQDVQHVLQRVDHTVKHSLRGDTETD